MAFVLFIKSVANLLTNSAAIQRRLAWGRALPVTSWEETNRHVDLKADIWLHQRSAQIVSTVILAMSSWFNSVSCVASFDCNSTPCALVRLVSLPRLLRHLSMISTALHLQHNCTQIDISAACQQHGLHWLFVVLQNVTVLSFYTSQVKIQVSAGQSCSLVKSPSQVTHLIT